MATDTKQFVSLSGGPYDGLTYEAMDSPRIQFPTAARCVKHVAKDGEEYMAFGAVNYVRTERFVDGMRVYEFAR